MRHGNSNNSLLFLIAPLLAMTVAVAGEGAGTPTVTRDGANSTAIPMAEVLSPAVAKPVPPTTMPTAEDWVVSKTPTADSILPALTVGDFGGDSISIVATSFIVARTGLPDVSSLSLDDAIRIAMRFNEEIRESYGYISAAKAGVTSAQGAYDLNLFSSNQYGRWNSLNEKDYALPTNAATSYFRSDSGFRQRIPTGGTVSAYYTTSREPLLGVGGSHLQTKDYLTIDFVQSLLRGIGDKENQAAIRKAAIAVENSEASRVMAVSRVTLDVVRAYHILALAHRNKEVAKRILDMANEVLQREGVRTESGIAQQVDVDRARMAVRQREYTVLPGTTH